jgi:hypothetical protein
MRNYRASRATVPSCYLKLKIEAGRIKPRKTKSSSEEHDKAGVVNLY